MKKGRKSNRVGHLRVPDEIISAMDAGEWTLPSDESEIVNLFTEPPAPSGKLYSWDEMVRETVAWWEAPADEYEYYGAEAGKSGSYETVEPSRSILIGDLGVDMPLALDYGPSVDRPRIMYVPSYGQGWIEVAPDVQLFLRKLRP